MHLTSLAQTAAKALRANTGRSILTVLGIVIGIVAIVLVLSLGRGAQQLIVDQVQGIGANAVIVRPGREPRGPTDVAETILSDSLTGRDIAALARKQNVPNAESIDPAVLVSGPVSYQNDVFRPTTLGWTARAMRDIFRVEPAQGSFFTEDDIRQNAKVAVIGSRVKTELFGDSDALEQLIRIRGQNMRVVGVFPPGGQVAVFNIDELVLVPYTTAQKALLGIDYFHEIFIRADDAANVDLVAADVKATLRAQHNIVDPSKDDFFVVTQQDAIKTIATITNTLTVFLVAMASISLVVGGIGIMNIMLVSVTERTHEIGLRKAVGATNRDILTQFLIEAVMLTVAGGLFGTAIAAGLVGVVALIARTRFGIDWAYSLPISAVMLGIGVAAAIGIGFGLYPARKAARKDPIEALRYE